MSKTHTTKESENLMFTENLSPYKFAVSVGKRPQMVYNYISKGYIKAETNDLGKKFITPDEMNRMHEVWFPTTSDEEENVTDEV